MSVNIHKLSIEQTISILCFLVLLSVNSLLAQERKTFATLNYVLETAKAKNVAFKNDLIQADLAELTKKTAIGNVLNPRIPTSFQMINNTQIQANFLPAEIFGGPAGTFREVAFGQQYVATFNVQPQFDIINLAAFEQIKSAKINQKLVDNQQKIAEQRLYDQLNAIYFNILSFQGQKEILVENIAIAEKIKAITERKWKEGIARKQELNDADINVISLQDKFSQLEMSIKIQQQSLALFFENSLEPNLSQSVWDFENSSQNIATNNNLSLENYDLQLKMAKQDFKVAKYQQLPTLGFISSFIWQNNSNSGFYSKNSNGINARYMGLRLNWDLPTNVQKLTSVRSKAMSLETLRNNAEHAKNENDTKNNQLILEYQKSISQLANLKKIFALKEDTYTKNYNQFMENIFGLDKLLASQNDLLNSKLNIVATLATIGFNKGKIDINNKF